ncbi:MAG: hypothetical protein KJZ83_04355 [Burkholderiaceae bacterium]|nr:hypothetical protein [Burkholderiaceae bacterium]
MSAPRGAAVVPPRAPAPAFGRLPLVAAGLASLVIGTVAGLARAGLDLPAIHASVHAPLMIGGFLGTVISLERAVALGARWGYLAPAIAALAAAVLWLWPDAPAAGGAGLTGELSGLRVAAEMQLFGGFLLAFICWRLHRRQPATHSRVLIAAALCWPVGTATWLFTADPGRGVVAWISFLVLTIAAERLELSRFMPTRRRTLAGFLAGVAIFLVAVAVSIVDSDAGKAALGVGALVLAAWLARNDIARRTARLPGLAGFIGKSLLAGYFWLAAGGVLIGAQAIGLRAADGAWLGDAAVHALLLGFVMSMVLAHAPVIFPAVMRVSMPWHWSFYVPALLLNASLLLRVGGDVALNPAVREAGAAGNALALAAFLVSTISAVIRGARAGRS